MSLSAKSGDHLATIFAMSIKYLVKFRRVNFRREDFTRDECIQIAEVMIEWLDDYMISRRQYAAQLNRVTGSGQDGTHENVTSSLRKHDFSDPPPAQAIARRR